MSGSVSSRPATVAPDAKVFPSGQIAMTAVADQTISMFQAVCSYQFPPLTQGLGIFDFHAVNGPSTLSIS